MVGIGTPTPSYKLELDGSGDLLSIGDTAGNSFFNVTDTQIQNNLPASFNAAGDVALAYDLNFTNQVQSNINSNGPLSLNAGENWESNDLNLNTFNNGNILLAPNNASAKVGIGIANPQAPLHVYNPTNFDPSLTYGSPAGAIINNASVDLAMGTANASPYTFWMQARQSGNNAWPLSLNPLGGNVGIGTSNPYYQTCRR